MSQFLAAGQESSSMQRLNGFENPSAYRGGVLSIGNFDGVHLGHQQILNELVARSKEHNVPSIVMTFEPHPLTLLNPSYHPPRLTTPAQKSALIEDMGVDVLLEYPTDKELLSFSPQRFFDEIIVKEFEALGLVEGPNFFFGHQRSGNVEILAEFCQQTDRFLKVVAPYELDGKIVSSSRIRESLASGDVELASQLLNRPYSIEGIVSLGMQRGRTLGFPTANLHQIPTLLPKEGVYAALAEVNQARYPAAVNVGSNPTFCEPEAKVEAHLIGFTGDLYGQTVRLEFIKTIRPLIRFENVEALLSQLQQDVSQAAAILN